MGRSSRRAAAWVVMVAAISSMRLAARRSGREAVVPRLNSEMAITAPAAILTMPAMAELAPRASSRLRSTVAVSTAACRAMVSPSQTISPTADHAAMRAVSAATRGPMAVAKGRARTKRNSTPPSAIDCAMMVSPWMMIER